MFYAKLNEGLLFKKLIDCIKDLTFININISSKGISMYAIDSKYKSYISLDLPSERFEKYRCNDIINLKISINKLETILSYIQKDDSLILFSKERNKLKIKYENKCKIIFLKLINILFFI